MRSQRASIKASAHYVSLGERIALEVPLTTTLSEDAQHGIGKGGGVFLRDEASEARDAIGWELKNALRGRVLHPRTKVYLDVFVRRSDMKGDPINLLDATADAVKGVVGVDDRWFAVAGLDWELVRHERPFLRIQVWQAADSN